MVVLRLLVGRLFQPFALATSPVLKQVVGVRGPRIKW